MEFLLKEINISTVHVLMERFIPVPTQDLGRHVLTSRNEDKKNKSSCSETCRSRGPGLQVSNSCMSSPSEVGKLASGTW